MRSYLLTASFLLAIIGTVAGQTLHQDVQTTYNFEPHKLSSEQQQEKSKLLDNFWKKVTENKQQYLPELRKELQDTSNSNYFSYDGSHLLLSLSKSPEDYHLALTAALRGNLLDIDGADYVQTMNFFASKGLNTTDAGLRIISMHDFSAYFPQHSLMLDKYNSLLFVLLPIKSDLYTTKLLTALKQTKDTETIISVLHFLDYVCTCSADSIILRYSTDNAQLDTIRKIASLIVKNNSKVPRRENPTRYDDLVKQRNEILGRVSDEALYELDDVTNKLKGNYICH
jgi:hypothetical protein